MYMYVSCVQMSCTKHVKRVCIVGKRVRERERECEYVEDGRGRRRSKSRRTAAVSHHQLSASTYGLQFGIQSLVCSVRERVVTRGKLAGCNVAVRDRGRRVKRLFITAT